MAKNTLSFKQEMERITGGNYRLGKEDPLKRELEKTVNSLTNQLAALETALAEANEEICVSREEKESALCREKHRMEEFEAERDRLHRVIQRLSDENKDLSKQVKEITSQRKDLETRNRLEDKYRRALVYIDALQSKLSATPTPPRGVSSNRRPPPFFR
jgi:chromosome segregation ATPase